MPGCVREQVGGATCGVGWAGTAHGSAAFPELASAAARGHWSVCPEGPGDSHSSVTLWGAKEGGLG